LTALSSRRLALRSMHLVSLGFAYLDTRQAYSNLNITAIS
jgi:hypothetical protein